MRDINWSKVSQCRHANKAYINFFNIIEDSLYDEYFPVAKIRLKQKKLFTPWITRGIKKSSKRKQKLYEKFQNNKTILNEEKYKAYKNLFESINRKSKKSYFLKKILQYKNNTKKTWSVMKEIIRKMHQHNKSKLPCKLFVDRKYITLETEIAKTFNEFLTEISPSLARMVPTPNKPFENFLRKNSTALPERCLTISELENVFFSPKKNKSTGADEISFNVIKNYFGELSDILRYVFDLSLQTGISLDPLKITTVTTVFKTGDHKEISNYRPIHALPCFSKILERIMHNRLYSYLVKGKILYSKQFGFQKGCHCSIG